MTRHSRPVAAIVVAVAFLSIGGMGSGAWGAAISEKPTVFEAAAVNLVVLPYEYVGKNVSSRVLAAQNLGALVHLEALFSILKYGSIGAVLTVGPSEGFEDSPDEVIDRLIGRIPGSQQHVQPGRGLVVVWGKLYESGPNIYVQTTVRYMRRDRTEDIHVRIAGQEFTAGPAGQDLAFPPRQLTMSDLIAIRSKYANMLVRTEPRDGAPGVPLALGGKNKTLAFSVLETRGRWMHIRSWRNGPSGWVHGTIEDASFTLRAKMPELEMIELLVGYERCRQAMAEKSGSNPGQFIDPVAEALRRCASRGDRELGRVPFAVGQQLLGILLFLRDSSPGDRAAARQYFGAAAELIPESAEARNLAIVGELDRGATNVDDSSCRSFATLASMAPTNARLTGNLLSCYRLTRAFRVDTSVATHPDTTSPSAQQRLDLERKIRRLESVQAARSAGVKGKGGHH